MKSINDMSFDELRNELARCRNNPTKEMLLRRIMLLKYKNNMTNQQNNIRKQNQINQIIQTQPIQTQPIQQYKQKMLNDLADDLLEDLLEDTGEDNDVTSLSDDDFNFNATPKINSLNELDDDRPDLVDGREITERTKDKMNHSMMDRLNSDIDIRNMKTMNDPRRRPLISKNDFIKPFADENDGQYASFNTGILKVNKFSNKKFNG
jgi:hypothetical protein